MKKLIKIFRNIPPGKGCSTLTKNVLDVVYEGSVDYDVDKKMDITTKDFEVQLLPFPSKIAEERGISRIIQQRIRGHSLSEIYLSTIPVKVYRIALKTS